MSLGRIEPMGGSGLGRDSANLVANVTLDEVERIAI
jgi:hypothetical protein